MAVFDLIGYEDSEALHLSQKISGALLEPPKELYDKIHNDLSAIRKAFPIVADVRHQLNYSFGKIICMNFSITFKKPYNPKALIKVLTEKEFVTDCEADDTFGISSQIIVGPDDSYKFWKGWGDVPSGCIHKHYWTFSVKEGNIILVNETGDELPDSYSD